MGSYFKVLKNYATFSGRASRQEFWMFVLFNVIIGVVLSIIDRTAGLTFGPNGSQGILQTIYTLAVLLPGIAVAVRRLHDMGKSGLHLFVALVPCVGGLILIYWYVQPSEPGANMYGANPNTTA